MTLTNRGLTAPAPAGYARLYGTSFAAPQVAGTIAHMLSLNPALSYEQIVQGLRLSARPHVTSPKIAECSDANPGRCICTTATCGAGILDAEQAMLYATGRTATCRRRARRRSSTTPMSMPRWRGPRRTGRPTWCGSTGDSGGGAMGGFWLMALFTAAWTLRAVRPASARLSAAPYRR